MSRVAKSNNVFRARWAVSDVMGARQCGVAESVMIREGRLVQLGEGRLVFRSQRRKRGERKWKVGEIGREAAPCNLGQ